MHSPFHYLRTAWCIAVLMLLTTTLPAQYFGRNKVQYDDFDFEILKTRHFDVYFYNSDTAIIPDAGRMLERWHSRFQPVFNSALSRTQPVILYNNHADFQQTDLTQGMIGQGTGGFTEGLRNRIVMPMTGVQGETNHVLGHELVHGFQYDLAGRRERGLSRFTKMPLWIVEGMAEYLSVGRSDAQTAMWMRDAVLHDDLPDAETLSRDPRYFPYRWGHAFWAYVAGRWGDAVIGDLFRGALSTNLDSAFTTHLGRSPDSLVGEWHDTLRATCEAALTGRDNPARIGRRLLGDTTGQNRLNLAPTISPDGKTIAFLSERALFQIELFLADARSGEIIDRLSSSGGNPHFDAIRFMNGSGSWSPDGSRFAAVVFSKGDNAVALYDVAKREVYRTVRLPGNGAIFDVDWSPDGNTLAISGSHNGVSDLFLYDLTTQRITPLTNDRRAALQPAWSPDGRTLAYMSDRGTPHGEDDLSPRSMRIVLHDIASEENRVLDIFPDGGQYNPRFAPDGSALYVVADPDGVRNIYRYHLTSGAIDRLTNVATGIAGLTELAPCLSIAGESGRIVFNVFDDRRYAVHAIDPDSVDVTPIRRGEGTRTAALLPPARAYRSSLVSGYLARPGEGLPPDTLSRTTDYHPSLSLQAIGQGGIGIGTSQFGTYVGGGASALFSDMLNEHLLLTAIQSNGGLKDIGGQVRYINRTERLNWGGGISRFPYRLERSFVGLDTVTVDGDPFLARTLDIERVRIYDDRLTLLGAYPLSRNRRIEASVGYNRISYDVETERFFSDRNGVIFDSETIDGDAPSAINQAVTSVAYVGDYSFFGFTSPVRGSRYRVEAEPTIGTLSYVTALADYRHYWFWNPLTVAARVMHYGRYGADSESNRLTQLYLGYDTFSCADTGAFPPRNAGAGMPETAPPMTACAVRAWRWPTSSCAFRCSARRGWA